MPPSLNREGLGVGLELRHPTPKSLVDAPRSKIQILRAVVVAEQLGVEGDDVVDVAVGHHYGILLAQDVMPRADGRRALTDADDTGFAVVVAEAAVGLLHDVGGPHHLGSRPVHDDVLPVDEVLAHPHLCRPVAIACAVGGGIQVEGVAKLTDGGVGKVAGNEGVGISRCVPGGALDWRRSVLTLCTCGA